MLDGVFEKGSKVLQRVLGRVPPQDLALVGSERQSHNFPASYNKDPTI